MPNLAWIGQGGGYRLTVQHSSTPSCGIWPDWERGGNWSSILENLVNLTDFDGLSDQIVFRTKYIFWLWFPSHPFLPLSLSFPPSHSHSSTSILFHFLPFYCPSFPSPFPSLHFPPIFLSSVRIACCWYCSGSVMLTFSSLYLSWNITTHSDQLELLLTTHIPSCWGMMGYEYR